MYNEKMQMYVWLLHIGIDFESRDEVQVIFKTEGEMYLFIYLLTTQIYTAAYLWKVYLGCILKSSKIS